MKDKETARDTTFPVNQEGNQVESADSHLSFKTLSSVGTPKPALMAHLKSIRGHKDVLMEEVPLDSFNTQLAYLTGQVQSVVKSIRFKEDLLVRQAQDNAKLLEALNEVCEKLANDSNKKSTALCWSNCDIF